MSINYILTLPFRMLCGSCVVQIQLRIHVLLCSRQILRDPNGNANYCIDHADQGSICPERSRSWTVLGIDHTDHIDHLPDVWGLVENDPLCVGNIYQVLVFAVFCVWFRVCVFNATLTVIFDHGDVSCLSGSLKNSRKKDKMSVFRTNPSDLFHTKNSTETTIFHPFWAVLPFRRQITWI